MVLSGIRILLLAYVHWQTLAPSTKSKDEITILRKRNKRLVICHVTPVSVFTCQKKTRPKRCFFSSIATNRYILSFCVLFRRRIYYFFHRHTWNDNRLINMGRKEGCRRDPFHNRIKASTWLLWTRQWTSNFQLTGWARKTLCCIMALGILLLYFNTTYSSWELIKCCFKRTTA